MIELGLPWLGIFALVGLALLGLWALTVLILAYLGSFETEKRWKQGRIKK